MSNTQTTPKPIDRDEQAVACLTVRDIFAAHALNAFVTSRDGYELEELVKLAYLAADLMLEERAK